MKLAIMQPYFFPYIGYFQLIRAVDVFVVYDDVNYIKRGWINRNNILLNGKSQLITLPLQDASQNKLINQLEIGGQHKILKSLRYSYVNAPYFDAVYAVIEDIFMQAEKNLARFLYYQLRQICGYLGLNPQWHISSELAKDNQLRGSDKILAICKELEATHYINLSGGIKLYDRRLFEEGGMNLSFIQPIQTTYLQFGNQFVSNLSIIDVMMFNSPVDINKNILNGFELVK
jgi:hypothetical protein